MGRASSGRGGVRGPGARLGKAGRSLALRNSAQGVSGPSRGESRHNWVKPGEVGHEGGHVLEGMGGCGEGPELKNCRW